VASWPALPLPGGAQRLALHSGVHSGLVYVSGGDIARGRLDVVGDAANTAARLASYSGRNGILVDADSLGPELPFFESNGEQELVLPGRAVPVRAVRITGLTGLRRRIDFVHPRGLSPLLGRGELLRDLLQACESGAAPDGRLLEIRGPAGIGKTRVLDELAEELARRGVTCLRGGCESYGITPVLEPFRQILAAMRPPGATVDAPPVFIDAGDVREHIVHAIKARGDRLLVLLLDDWHWADDASRQLLDDVLGSTALLRAVIATRPGDESHDDRQRRVFLPRPLTAGETREVVEALVPGTNPFLVDKLHEYAGGVPLLVEEMCHVLRHRGEEGWHALHHGGPRTGSGSWMKSMMAARLDRLPERLRSAAQAAAVLGIRAPRALLNDLIPNDCEDAVLQALSDADVLYTDSADNICFRHGLSRDAVYELIPLEHRVALHRKVVSLLERGHHASWTAAERLEALAHHTTAAGDWAQATLRCEAAADAASRLGAFDSARRHYVGAIEAAEFAGIDLPQAALRWCSLVHRLGMTCMFDPLALPDAMPLVERCTTTARALGDAENLTRSLYWQAYLGYVFGEPRRAARLAREALALATTHGNRRLVAQIEATLGQALAGACEYSEALMLMDRALQTKQAQSQRSGSLAIGSAFTLACRASVVADQGNFAAAHDALGRARALIAAQPAHPVANSVRNWEMVVLAWQGRWDDALRVVGETVRLAERSHALLPLAIARAVGGYAHWRRTRDSAPVLEVVQAVRWMESRRVLFFTTIYYGWLVEMCVAEGRHEEAHGWAWRLLRRSRAGERLGEAVGWRALAASALARGDPARAQVRLRRAEASARRRESARETALNELFRAELLRAESRLGDAAVLVASAEAQLRAMGVADIELPRGLLAR
jgi:tetratricopeptide (TPR) repeat protein